jgi:hypothetical protein
MVKIFTTKTSEYQPRATAAPVALQHHLERIAK